MNPNAKKETSREMNKLCRAQSIAVPSRNAMDGDTTEPTKKWIGGAFCKRLYPMFVVGRVTGGDWNYDDGVGWV